MDKVELTEENLKQVLVDEYSRAVALRQDCEEGFRTLNIDDICVFISDTETTVEFPCLQVGSRAYWCAVRASTEASKLFFGNDMREEDDFRLVISNVPRDQFNLKDTHGRFVWCHHR